MKYEVYSLITHYKMVQMVTVHLKDTVQLTVASQMDIAIDADLSQDLQKDVIYFQRVLFVMLMKIR